jgi:hypothetical protein
MSIDENYSFEDFENDSAEYYSKNQLEPFLYKLHNILYPNPEFLSESIPENIHSHKIHMCIFYIETICVLPFVKYAVLKDPDNKTVSFIELDEIDNSDYLEEECMKQLDWKDSDQFDESYRGYFTKNDNIYMFFDITSMLNANHKFNQKFTYAVAHELCHLKTVFDYAIGDNIKNMFDVDETTFPKCAILQPWFYNLDGMLEMIEMPHIGYICMTDTSKDLYSLTDDEITKIFVPSDCLIDYDDVGIYYYFSKDVINPIEGKSYIRFVIFSMKTHKVNLSHKQKNTETEEFNSISFSKNGTEIRGIKSIDQFILF